MPVTVTETAASAPLPREKISWCAPAYCFLLPSAVVSASACFGIVKATVALPPAATLTRWKSTSRLVGSGCAVPTAARIAADRLSYTSTTSSPAMLPVFITLAVQEIASASTTASQLAVCENVVRLRPVPNANSGVPW